MPRGLVRAVHRHWRLLVCLAALIYVCLARKHQRSRGSARMEAYRRQHAESIEHNEEFWRARALEYLAWTRPFTTVYSGDFARAQGEWFCDGMLSVAYNCVDRHAAATPGRTALLWEGDEPGTGRRVTFLQLQEETSRLAHYLAAQGVRQGDAVTIYMPMVPEAVFAMLACARLGATHNTVFAGFSAEALADRLADSRSRVLITADEGVRGGKSIPLKSIADRAVALSSAGVERVLVFRRTGAPVPFGAPRDHWWHEQVPPQPGYFAPVPVGAEHPLFMLYTSGSTGRPKGLVHASAGYLLYAAVTHRLVFDVREGDVFGCLADVGWITGHSYIVYGPLCNGVTTVLFESTPVYPTPSRYWQTVERLRITQLYTAPTVIRALRKFGDGPVAGHDLSSLRTLGTVGEPISPDAWAWYAQAVGGGRCPVVDTYWQTETGGHVVTPLAGTTATKPGAATLPFLGIEANLVDPLTGRVLAEDGVEGVLVLSRPWPGIARTILGDHQKYYDTYFRAYPGHYCTGDRAYRDADGYLWIRGRVDDVINVSGHRLSTAEIEAALGSHAACAEAAVLGSPDEITGQAVWAFVIPRTGAAVEPAGRLEQELRDAVRRRIGAFAAPKRVLLVPDLPKTRSGKIMRRVIRKILEGATEPGQLGDLSTIQNPEVIDQLLALVHGPAGGV